MKLVIKVMYSLGFLIGVGLTAYANGKQVATTRSTDDA